MTFLCVGAIARHCLIAPAPRKTSPVQQNGTTPDEAILRPYLHPAKAGGPGLLTHTRQTLIQSLHTSSADASFHLAFSLRSSWRLSLLLCICRCISLPFPASVSHWNRHPFCLLSMTIDAPSFSILPHGSHAGRIVLISVTHANASA